MRGKGYVEDTGRGAVKNMNDKLLSFVEFASQLGDLEGFANETIAKSAAGWINEIENYLSSMQEVFNRTQNNPNFQG